jgi:hypothetical protein
LHGLLKSAGSQPDINTAMRMAHKLHQLPLTMYDDAEFQDAIRARLKINEAVITASLARKFLEIE